MDGGVPAGLLQHEPQVVVRLGHVDILGRFQRHVVVRGRQARVGEAKVCVGTVGLDARRVRAA